MNIGIVILNYNTFEETIKLVEDLQHQTLAKYFQIIVVDNCSPNDSYVNLKPLEKLNQNVFILQTGENLGYAKGNNFGLHYLDNHIRPNYVAVLNNDIVLPANCFEKLIEKHQVLDNPGIIAPKQLDPKNKELLPYRMNSFLDDCLNLFFVFKIFHKRNAIKYYDNTGLRAMKVEMIPGSFMFADFEKFKSMGFFYPNTFLFAEERFIAVKAKQMSLNNYILLDESYIHAHSNTINTAFTQVGKYRLLYDSWIEFTKVCHAHGNLKAAILKPLMKISILEMRLVYGVKTILKRSK